MESVFSRKVRAGRRRTYFFDVRQTKGDDYYLTLTESTRKFNGEGYERHKIFLYKEDFNRFVENLQEVIDHIKSDLMPEYDYDEYTKKHAEWEQQRLEEEAAGLNTTSKNESDGTTTDDTTTDDTTTEDTTTDEAPSVEEPEAPQEMDSEEGDVSGDVTNEDDMSW